jgi:hypothetical protein
MKGGVRVDSIVHSHAVVHGDFVVSFGYFLVANSLETA